MRPSADAINAAMASSNGTGNTTAAEIDAAIRNQH
jgi:hypothetical protein